MDISKSIIFVIEEDIKLINYVVEFVIENINIFYVNEVCVMRG